MDNSNDPNTLGGVAPELGSAPSAPQSADLSAMPNASPDLLVSPTPDVVPPIHADAPIVSAPDVQPIQTLAASQQTPDLAQTQVAGQPPDTLVSSTPDAQTLGKVVVEEVATPPDTATSEPLTVISTDTAPQTGDLEVPVAPANTDALPDQTDNVAPPADWATKSNYGQGVPTFPNEGQNIGGEFKSPVVESPAPSPREPEIANTGVMATGAIDIAGLNARVAAGETPGGSPLPNPAEAPAPVLPISPETPSATQSVPGLDVPVATPEPVVPIQQPEPMPVQQANPDLVQSQQTAQPVAEKPVRRSLLNPSTWFKKS